MSRGLSATPEERPAVSIALLVGTLCFLAAVTVAEANPAVGYEVSIYDSTPLFFWASIGVALLAGVAALVLERSWIQWAGGLALTGLSMLSVAALPLIRGYYFYGISDGLRHLGKVRQFASGEMSFFEEVYPGAYSFSSFLSAFSGVSIEQSMLLVVFVMMVIYVIFITLCVRAILPGRRAIKIAAVSALMLLPLNQISFHPHFHTFSMASFFTPVLLYIVIRHITDHGADETIPGRLSSTDIGFVVTAVAIVFYHPQTTVSVVIILGTIAAIQHGCSRWFPDTKLASSPPVYGQLLFLMAFFALWNLQHDVVFNASSNLLDSLNGWILGTEQAGEVVTERAGSAESVGLGIGELFVKLFLVPTFYVLAAGASVAAGLFSEKSDGEGPMITMTFSLAGVALGVFSLAHFVGEMSGYFFRYLGFGMVLVTIVAVVGLTKAGDHIDELRPSLARLVKMVAVVGLVVALTLSILMVFPSPYVSLPTHHVSEQTYTGHETTMEYRAEGAALASARSGPLPYADAMARDLDPRLAWGVPSEALPSDLRRFRGNDFATREFYYYIQTDQNELKEMVAYGGLRYDESDFRGVGETVGVSRVITNGPVNVYHVEYADGPVIGDPQIASPELPTDRSAGDPQSGVTA
jgi:hypothetical protein